MICFKVVLLAIMAISRFRRLKENEMNKKLSKALPTSDSQNLSSTSDSDDDPDEETSDKVKLNF